LTVDAPALQARAPQWVDDALGVGRVEMLTAIIADAASMNAGTLRARVADAYARLGESVRESGNAPIRLWNYLPDPNHVMAPGLDRYMVFNAGRFDGYRQWSGKPDAGGELVRSLATASGVGVAGSDLTIHCLTSPEHGVPVENPRQTPAWRYSARYGPMPPCFSRATIAEIGGRRRLLIGGTASIVGEDSRHERDVVSQVEETMANLAALIGAARRMPEPDDLALARLTDLRAYVVRPEDAEVVWPLLRARCSRARRIELTTARLCRPELLIEIEGVADI
jgi:chorismate lyase/3-hydroxybenzoate synthase